MADIEKLTEILYNWVKYDTSKTRQECYEMAKRILEMRQ